MGDNRNKHNVKQKVVTLSLTVLPSHSNIMDIEGAENEQFVNNEDNERIGKGIYFKDPDDMSDSEKLYNCVCNIYNKRTTNDIDDNTKGFHDVEPNKKDVQSKKND